MRASRPLTVAAAAMLVGAGAVAGFLLAPALGVAQSPAARGSTETYRQLSLFGEVFERVRADYVEAPTDEALIEAAINGMLSSLDPHSGFLNPRNFRDMQVQTRGEFGGLGIEVTMENGLVKVVSPIDETPAARAGVRPGDFITHLNGEPVMGLTLNEAVERMRGPVNTDLKITIRREGRDPFELTLTRARIQVQSVRSEILNNEVGYVRISSFTEQTTAGLERALTRFKDAKVRGVVLDMRNNPGGLLDQAVSVSDAFLERGEIVSTRGRRTDEAQRWNAKVGDLTGGLPVVVLINGGSASASEIVAGALQDHRRAIVMGTKSFGKGSVQTIMPLGNAGAMRLTTARYYTPSGRSIQQLGIDPDIVVPAARIETVDEGQRRREADLRGSLRNTDQPAEQRPAPVAPARDATQAPTLGSPDDYQLARAVDLLRGVALFGTNRAN
ncbi:MAG: S41 family peptidase [Alphaproteobacteria bacterium]|nr:S41 family peptidase [Alphaproteobacteria bacterium]TAD90228.1 MAG: S41 family peptidase [Alphaproteobacteria bacterium]